jgi:iron complex transport system permease protein
MLSAHAHTAGKRPLFWGAALVACPLSILAACAFGPFALNAGEVASILLKGLSGAGMDAANPAELVVLRIRLSRVLLAFVTGGGLAVAGAVFQGLLRNPLADPFTLGVSGGAAFGASLAITLGLAAALVPVSALAGAAAALSLVLLLGQVGGTLRRETLVLAGVVVASFLAALISLVKTLDEDSVAGIVFWIMGSFQNRGWQDMPLLVPGVLLGLGPVTLLARELDLLALGDREARQLGLAAGRSRFWLLLGASCITASCVAVSGVIGFVGLVVPHLVRLLLGARHVPLLFGSALGGGLLLLWSDVLARSLLAEGRELPVGVITALLGGPFFCLLLRRSARAGALP